MTEIQPRWTVEKARRHVRRLAQLTDVFRALGMLDDAAECDALRDEIDMLIQQAEWK